MTTKISRFKGSRLARGFETSADAEQNGVWRVHPDSGIHVRVRRSTLPEHKMAIRKHYKPFAHLTSVPARDELLVKQKAAAEVLIADWGQTPEDENGAFMKDGAGEFVREPMTDAAGMEIRPTHENVLDAFIAMPDFFQWVSGEADTFEHYRVSVVEAAAGNSPGTSAGSASGEAPKPLPSSSDVPLAALPSHTVPAVPS